MEPQDPFPELAEPLAEKMAAVLACGQDGASKVNWNAELLIELRDLAHSRCSRDWRYSESQLQYHYTKDKTFLTENVPNEE